MLTSPLITFAAQAVDSQDLSGIAAWTVELMNTLGGFGLALIIAIENVFPPIPSEVVLPLAGFTASQGGTLSFAGALIWSTLGSLLGALILYGIAYLFGRERSRALLLWLPLTRESDVDKTENFFEKYDKPTVFFGRMLPIFRSLISLPAGIVKMNIALFIVLTTAGSLIWNTALISAGYLLGDNWALVENYVGLGSKIMAVIIVIALIVWAVIRIRASKKR
ncbi:DedA family protein [Arcanobacterium pinnipediorum]|uniref:DedA family protein n=1 Tax=Arcanobacterium pinnipediorum TaxID=1503041 RepID=A0ABY5AH37_9ACTO|nr:DedA family protein [Arcanobacterium pinnipediorum]USR79524.1 DedA family protein [Arcanobacterium pinnipediorum]